jgi:uncharacterized protein (TIGR02145 family)
MNKANVFKSSNFYMGQGDVLHILVDGETGSQVSLELYGASIIPEATSWGDLRDYDGNLYTEVVIGTQRWIVENLKTTHYADGTLIPNLTLDANWMAEDGSAGHDGARCYYNNDVGYFEDYGLLYNWYAVKNTKQLAYFERDGVQELGWRVPTNADYLTLLNYLGGKVIAGGKLKEIGTNHWDSPNYGATNSSGFSGRGSGLREWDGAFNYFKNQLDVWSSTPYEFAPDFTAYYVALGFNSNVHAENDFAVIQGMGYAVRCVKDTTFNYLYDYDNNQYKVVTIGNQQWIVENLKTTHYADGTPIANITDNALWIADTLGAYAWYDNDSFAYSDYGCLYNWGAINNAHGLAYLKDATGVQQTGWRLPTATDLLNLSTLLGGDTLAGAKLKEVGNDHWIAPNVGATDEVGFKLIGAGYRTYPPGAFALITEEGSIATSTESDATTFDGAYIDHDSSTLVRLSSAFMKRAGVSVRLVRNI